MIEYSIKYSEKKQWIVTRKTEKAETILGRFERKSEAVFVARTEAAGKRMAEVIEFDRKGRELRRYRPKQNTSRIFN